MKKAIVHILCMIAGFVAGAAALLLFFRLSDRQVVDNAIGAASPDTTVSTADASKQELLELAFETAGYIKSGDFNGLANVVHPVYGVVISPSGTVNLKLNRCFTAAEVSGFHDDTTVYVWGVDGQSNVPIEMKAADYFGEYVSDHDYYNADVIGIDRIVRSGNSLENVADAFPNARFVDLTFAGTEENEYRDWSILRLVFEDYEGTYRLTAIIHSEYTI